MYTSIMATKSSQLLLWEFRHGLGRQSVSSGCQMQPESPLQQSNQRFPLMTSQFINHHAVFMDFKVHCISQFKKNTLQFWNTQSFKECSYFCFKILRTLHYVLLCQPIVVHSMSIHMFYYCRIVIWVTNHVINPFTENQFDCMYEDGACNYYTRSYLGYPQAMIIQRSQIDHIVNNTSNDILLMPIYQ